MKCTARCRMTLTSMARRARVARERGEAAVRHGGVRAGHGLAMGGKVTFMHPCIFSFVELHWLAVRSRGRLQSAHPRWRQDDT
jgi:hypothetical protein